MAKTDYTDYYDDTYTAYEMEEGGCIICGRNHWLKLYEEW